jgi:Lhr-like helicase
MCKKIRKFDNRLTEIEEELNGILKLLENTDINIDTLLDMLKRIYGFKSEVKYYKEALHKRNTLLI